MGLASIFVSILKVIFMRVRVDGSARRSFKDWVNIGPITLFGEVPAQPLKAGELKSTSAFARPHQII
jgi:hypothetical protein